MPCVTFDKIEETDKTYFLHNDSYVFELPEPAKEKQQKAPFYGSFFNYITMVLLAFVIFF